MLRWNGWGEAAITMELPVISIQQLKEWIGETQPVPDYPLEQFLRRIPPSRLPAHPKISVDPQVRLFHAHGQSLVDWIGLRGGLLNTFPDGVAFPENREELKDLLEWAITNRVQVIPYGGGTSVVGHLTVPEGSKPVLTIALARMKRLLHLDEENRLATFEAGIRGPELEAQLNARGYTLGHFPQSFDFSTLGGWIVTRSSGQQSLYYGRMEQLFMGGEVLTPLGAFQLPILPASAAGPDLKQIVLGSEGRLGIVSQATVKFFPLPEVNDFYGVFFPSWEAGFQAVYRLSQKRLALSMIRLSNAEETRTQLALAGHETQIQWLKRYLRFRGIPEASACLCLFGLTGSKNAIHQSRAEIFRLFRSFHGVSLGKKLGESWRKNRFRTPYLRNTLWDLGYALDTLETAVTWNQVTPLMNKLQKVLGEGLQAWTEKVHVFTHLSHLYATGSSIYSTFLFRLASSPEETLARWKILKQAASSAIVEMGGTISHQHGVGLDHKPYLEAEKGVLGLQCLKQVLNYFDPQEQMNPSKLL
ncbi:MAG: FAD-binding oxidoreductase [Planctomycetota bacterium]